MEARRVETSIRYEVVLSTLTPCHWQDVDSVLLEAAVNILDRLALCAKQEVAPEDYEALAKAAEVLKRLAAPGINLSPDAAKFVEEVWRQANPD